MPLNEPKLTGLKKRQQIESASRTMFIWIAVASVAVSFCVVTSQFLFEKMLYNNKVVGAKLKAADTLNKNIDNANKLKQAVDGLVSNQELASVKTNPSDPNTKSVLDALPSKFDATALATSLQQAILSKSGVTIESITVPPEDASTQQTGANTNTSGAEAGPIEQTFTITVGGTYDKIRALVLDMERTIRPIKIKNINLSGSDADLRATIEASTYYQPAKSVNIKQETVGR